MTKSEAIGLIGKAFPQDDFRVLQQPVGADANTEKRVRELLQVHMESDGSVSAFVFADGDRVWICRAENEQGSDAVGRPLSRIEFARVGGERRVSSTVNLLMAAMREPLCDVLAGIADDAGSVPAAAHTTRARDAMLTILLGAAVATVADIEEARWVADEFGDDESVTLMHTSGRSPWRFASGALVVISAAPPATAESSLGQSIGSRIVPDVPGLRRVVDPAARRRLLDIWSRSLPLPEGKLSDAELTWLLTADVSRTSVVARAPVALCRQWLLENRLTGAEVESRRADWMSADHAAIARTLSATPDGLRRLIASVDPDLDVIARVLPSEALAVFSWLRSGATDAPPPHAVRIVPDLAQSGALNRLPLDTLSHARRVVESEPLCDVWIDVLAHQGVPRDVAGAFAGRIDRPILTGQPAPNEGCSWVNALPGDVLLRAGVWACSDREWRRWWTGALGVHAELRGLVHVGVDAPYSPSGVAWLIGSVRDKDIAVSETLTTLGRWVRKRESVTASETEALCAACALANADRWAAVVHGAGNLREIEPTAEHKNTLRLFFDADILSVRNIVAEVRAGAALEWLERVVAPSAFAILAARTQPPVSPPVEPPGDWDTALDELLSMVVVEPAFWKRWAGLGIHQVFVEWLLLRLGNEQGGALVERVASALRGEGRLDEDTLKIVAAGLSREVLAEQVAQWAQASPTSRALVFAHVRAVAGHAPAVEWLCNRVDLWSFAPGAPEGLTCRELVALLPWLDPVLVLRAAMSAPQKRESENALFDALFTRLATGVYLPIPAPPGAVASMRPSWVRRVATLPGWEAWSLASDLVSKQEEV